MNRVRLVLFLTGLTLFVILLVQQGTADVGRALATVGWGMIWVGLYHTIPLAANTLAWLFVIPSPRRPHFRRLLWMRWVGESVNNLLPVGQVGGDLLRARLLTHQGLHGPSASASVLVDFTLGLSTQALFALLGVTMLAASAGMAGQSGPLLWGSLAALVPLGLFLIAQQRGLFGFGAKVVARFSRGEGWLNVIGNARRLDRIARGLYARKRAVGPGALIRMASWLVGTGETWLILYYLGTPVSIADALILESLGYAVRSAAFAIPGALGVQEGGFMLVGALVGLTPTDALVISLVKRVREILLGAPGLLSWAVYEARRP